MTDPIQYLPVSNIASMLGISTPNVSAYRLPEPDDLKTRGWYRPRLSRGVGLVLVVVLVIGPERLVLPRSKLSRWGYRDTAIL